jgi:hypothetical protein
MALFLHVLHGEIFDLKPGFWAVWAVPLRLRASAGEMRMA